MIISTAGWIFGTMTGSTSLILLNKYIMTEYNFDWPIWLTTYHFLLTFLLLEIMCRMQLFERASSVPLYAKWLEGVYGVCGIVFMNFNLKMNSIGFYQLSKLACIPTMVLVNYILYSKKTPFRTLMALIILLIGLAMFSVNDVSFNISGTIMAVLAIISTTAFQTYTNVCSNKFNVGGPALQHQTALPQAILALVSSLSVETFGDNSIFYHYFALTESILVITTGVLAVISNICAFALIGKTSAVTYQVVGHAKTILIFVFGLMMFDSNKKEPLEKTIKKIIGLVLSMGGTIAYTVFEMQDKEKKKLEEEYLKQNLEKEKEESLYKNEDEQEETSNRDEFGKVEDGTKLDESEKVEDNHKE